jgi:3-phosphoshikimate 1-carboxyvinyltransferase
LSAGEDVARTADALRALGVAVTARDDGGVDIQGRGVGGLVEPLAAIDLGNSGTGARLLMGVGAQHAFQIIFTGDASLSRRPMQRVMSPLAEMGAAFSSREGGRLPLTMTGPDSLIPIEYVLPAPSAQVKSAILLAGLAAPGATIVIEPEPTRDHTERLLRHFGAEVTTEDGADGARTITLTGQPELRAANVRVPGDPSQAAFAVVAALLTPGSDVTVENVCVNPLRNGLFTTLIEMGGDIAYFNQRVEGGEAVADIRARHSRLHGIEPPPARAPSMIDEYPILAVAAAFAEGRTVLRGLAELRVKESDRLAVMAAGLRSCGVGVEELDDGLIVTGGPTAPGGGVIETHLDHRIAMSFAVLGMAADKAVRLDDGAPIDTSFPGFAGLFNDLGADIASLAGP